MSIRKLSLSRKPGELVVIGNDIVVSVVAVHGKKVCLSFEADESIPIDRLEVRAAKTVDGPLAKSGWKPLNTKDANSRRTDADGTDDCASQSTDATGS